MKGKKLISCILCLSLCFCFVLNVFGEAENTKEDPKELEEMIVAVKSQLDIPETYTKFDYDSCETQNGREYTLYWRNEGNDRITVSIDQKKHILGYFSVKNNETNSIAIPKHTREEALNKAKEFIRKIAPDASDKMVLRENTNYYTYGQKYDFSFYRIENDIPYYDNGIEISVDYTTLEIKNFQIRFDYDMEFKKPENIISKEKALSIIRENFTPKLQYLVNYEPFYGDEDRNKPAKAYLAYVLEDTYIAVDPISGKLLEKNADWEKYSNGGGAETEDASSTNQNAEGSKQITFSAEELKEIQESEKLFKVADIDALLKRNPYLALDQNYKISHSYLHKNTGYNNYYAWHIEYIGKVEKESFENPYVYVTVDAKTGEILSYYQSEKDYDSLGKIPKAKFTEEQNKVTAENFLKENTPAKLKEVSYKTSAPDYYYSKEDSYPISYSYTYERLYDNIPMPDNNLRVTVSSQTAKITSYYSNWFDNVDFESKAGIVSQNDAMSTILEGNQAGLQYESYYTYFYDTAGSKATIEEEYGEYIETPGPLSVVTPRLVYCLNPVTSFIVKARTGKLIRFWSGEEVSLSRKTAYTDMENHWAKEIADTLLSIGIGFEEDALKPNTEVRQKEFLYLLLKSNTGYAVVNQMDGLSVPSNQNALYRQLLDLGYILKEEIDPESAVTRIDAAKFMIRALGLEKAAKIPDIYTTAFTDGSAISKEMLGYAAIMQGLDIIRGDEKKNFYPQKSVTRAEALSMIYHFIQNGK